METSTAAIPTDDPQIPRCSLLRMWLQKDFYNDSFVSVQCCEQRKQSPANISYWLEARQAVTDMADV